jgi:hypothetical protein
MRQRRFRMSPVTTAPQLPPPLKNPESAFPKSTITYPANMSLFFHFGAGDDFLKSGADADEPSQ